MTEPDAGRARADLVTVEVAHRLAALAQAAISDGRIEEARGGVTGQQVEVRVHPAILAAVTHRSPLLGIRNL